MKSGILLNMKKTDEETIHAVMRLMPLMMQKIVSPYREVKPADLTSTQTQALMIIGEVKEIRMSELAAVMNIKKQQLTPIAAKLEICGYIRKNEDPTNRRSVFLQITPKGTAVLNDTDQQLVQALSNSFKELSESELHDLKRSADSVAEILVKIPSVHKKLQ